MQDGPRMMLFVCTGNICRSPMAEYLFRLRMPGNSGWRSASAGTAAYPGEPASPAAVHVMRELGMDLTPHRSQPVDAALVREADCIVCMAAHHKEALVRCFAEARGKTYLLHEFGTDLSPRDVPDPIGATAAVYRRIRDEIDGAMADLILQTREMK